MLDRRYCGALLTSPVRMMVRLVSVTAKLVMVSKGRNQLQDREIMPNQLLTLYSLPSSTKNPLVPLPRQQGKSMPARTEGS